jgi:L-ascorbate metabolism protein UlaG (beta-lactamase superfamily)
VIESGERFILIDPMLGDKGTLPPFSYIKHKARRNPIAGFPENAPELLDKVTHCLITHSQKLGLRPLQHTDHLDAAGEIFLKTRNIPVVTGSRDAGCLTGKGLNIESAPEYWTPSPFLGGSVTAIPALHGHGWIHAFMANGAGFFLELPGEPSLYISGDTVYTGDVERVLAELKPEISVIPCGAASLDVGGPILMPLGEILAFIRKAPGKVICNHLEALNHCPVTRAELAQALEKEGLASKVHVPSDGEMVSP